MKFNLRIITISVFLLLGGLLTGCTGNTLKATTSSGEVSSVDVSRFPKNPNLTVDYTKSSLQDIWLAGGCFWGVEAYMERVYGVAITEMLVMLMVIHKSLPMKMLVTKTRGMLKQYMFNMIHSASA